MRRRYKLLPLGWAPADGLHIMPRNSMSQGILPRPCVQSGAPRWPQRLAPVRALRPSDEKLLGLLAEHEMLTTTQLVRLLSLPERTVQHRLGCLFRAGLVNRLRPAALIGTSPYHCWLTGFGSAALGAGQPVAWLDDPAGVRATALLSELWLSVRDLGGAAGLHLQGWRRLRAGAEYEDARSGALRSLPVEAELTLALPHCGEAVTALVAARAGRLPAHRLVALFGRLAAYLASRGPVTSGLSLLVVCDTSRAAAAALQATGELAGTPVVRRLGATAVERAMARVAVGVAEPRPSQLATGAVWATPADRCPRRLADVLRPTGERCR